MAIKVELGRNGLMHDIRLEIKGRPIMDSVIKVAPILMEPADTLQVTFDLTIEGYVNGELTSSYPEKFSYIFELKRYITVQYIRFTKYKRKASIQVYAEIPTDHYEPSEWNAKKVYKKKDIRLKSTEQLKKQLKDVGFWKDD